MPLSRRRLRSQRRTAGWCASSSASWASPFLTHTSMSSWRAVASLPSQAAVDARIQPSRACLVRRRTRFHRGATSPGVGFVSSYLAVQDRPSRHALRLAAPRARRQSRAPRRLGASQPRPRRPRLHRPARPRGIVQVSFDPAHRVRRDARARAQRSAPRASCSSRATSSRARRRCGTPSWRRATSRCAAHRSGSSGRRTRPRSPSPRNRGEKLPAEELRLRHRYLDLRRPELQRQHHPAPPADAGDARVT